MTKYGGPIRSDLNASHRKPTGRPYDRLRDIERRARAGQPIQLTQQEAVVNIGIPEPRQPARTIEPRRVDPASPGERIAHALATCESPLGTQVPATDATDRELKNAQQAGTRWLARMGHNEWRLSYRRRDGGVVWLLTVKLPPRVRP